MSKELSIVKLQAVVKAFTSDESVSELEIYKSGVFENDSSDNEQDQDYSQILQNIQIPILQCCRFCAANAFWDQKGS